MGRATKVMAKNQEKFRSITLGKFRIMDSLEHIPAGLSVLMQDLCNDKSFNFPILRQYDIYKRLHKKKQCRGLKLLQRKGVYPYEHFKSMQHLKSSKYPPKEAFFSKLNDSHITEEDHQHGRKVYRFFKCRSMEDYMKLYCSLDVIILAEVFIKYREMVLHHFKLDPAYYLGNNSRFTLIFFFKNSFLDKLMFLLPQRKNIQEQFIWV